MIQAYLMLHLFQSRIGRNNKSKVLRSPQLVAMLEMKDSQKGYDGTEGGKDAAGYDQSQLHCQRVLVGIVENAVLRKDDQEEVDEVEVEQQGHQQHSAHLGSAEKATKGLAFLADAAVGEWLTAHRTTALLLAGYQLTETVQVVVALAVLAHTLLFVGLVFAAHTHRTTGHHHIWRTARLRDILLVAGQKRHGFIQ